jgi:hypothetical protein
MNRKVLKDFVGSKLSFVATYRKTTVSSGYAKSKMILLEDISSLSFDDVISHMWINDSHRFKSLNFFTGDKISFDAQIGTYIGLKLETKYRLHKVRNIKKL